MRPEESAALQRDGIESSSCRSLQREGDQCVLGPHPRRHDNELPARSRAIGHRVRRIGVRNRDAPDLLAGPGVERVEVFVAAANEDETAAGDESATAVVWRTEAVWQRDALEQRMIADRRVP